MTFDVNTLLGATFTEPNTRRPPIPAGTVLPGKFGTPTSRQTEGKKEKTQGQVFTFLEVPVELDLSSRPDLVAQIGQDKVQLTWSTRLDLTATGFDMSPGKNSGIRQLREALDLNKPGDTFALPMIEGRMVLCTVKNDPYEGEVYDKIGAIAQLK